MLDQMMMWLGYSVALVFTLAVGYWVVIYLYQLYVAMFIIGPSSREYEKYQAELQRPAEPNQSPPVTLDIDAVLEHRQTMSEYAGHDANCPYRHKGECICHRSDPRLNPTHGEHSIYVLSDAVFKAFSSFPGAIVLDRTVHIDHFGIKTEAGDYTVSIEEHGEDDEIIPPPFYRNTSRLPKTLKDHTTILDVVCIALGGTPKLQDMVSGLSTDGDHKDCEVDFCFHGKSWTIKVRR